MLMIVMVSYPCLCTWMKAIRGPSSPRKLGIDRLLEGDLIELPVELILKQIYYLSFFIHLSSVRRCFALVRVAVEPETIPGILDMS